MARPGVMFYFDIRPCIRRLSLEDKGRFSRRFWTTPRMASNQSWTVLWALRGTSSSLALILTQNSMS